MESAPLLRAVAKGMDEIKSEIESQLSPALKQSTAQNFIQHTSDEIMSDQPKIAHNIRIEFETWNQTERRYGLATQKFLLGDVDFSTKINDAREATKASELRAQAAQNAQEKIKGLSAKDAIDFVLISEGKTKHHIWDIKGLSPEVMATAKEIADAIKSSKKNTP